MTDPETHPLELILRECARSAPEPWYPSIYVHSTGVSREHLDPHLDRLRVGGLIRLTDWVSGSGQGYVLTPEGLLVLQNPKFLKRLREGTLPLRGEAPSVPHPGFERDTSHWDRGEEARAAILNPARPSVTFALIFINLAVFLAGLMLAIQGHGSVAAYLSGHNGEVLELTGSLSGRNVYVHHQWWRLLTACFVHIGVIHLAVNLYSLYIVGPLLERMWGHWRYLVLYLIAGFGGSCGMLYENPLGGGAGASGAIWGILASMATWIFLHRSVLPPGLKAQWRGWLLSVFLMNIFITLYIPGISKGGHFAGGAVGLLAGFPLDWLHFGRGLKRLLGLAGLVAIVLAGVGFLVWSQPRQKEFAEFIQEHAVQLDNVTDKACTVYDEPYDRADAPQVAKKLAGIRADLLRVAAQLDQAGPYSIADVEEARRSGQAYVQALIELLEMTEKDLTGNGNPGEESPARRKQEDRVVEARQKWESRKTAIFRGR